MITLSFSPTATERVLPKLALGFTTASLDPRVTFTRTTDATHPATYVNSSGVITAATNNQPRFDYDPVALTCKGLLIEESRTNACLYSSDYTQANWVKTAITIGTNATTAPDGTLTAQKLQEDNTANIHRITQTSSSLPCAKSFYAKAGERTNIYALIGPNTTYQFFVNLITGVVSGKGANVTSVTTKNAGNGWWRIEATTVTNAANIYIYSTDDAGNISYTGTTDYGFYLWGVQIENSAAFATSYIHTTTTALTRNADVATITGTAFSSFWRSGPGSILVRALPSTVSNTRPLVQVDDATADNIIALRGNTTNPELYIREGGADKATIDAGTISASAYRLAGAWQAGSAAASLNSGLAVNGAPASIPAATQMRLGSDGTNYLNGHLQTVQYWPLRLSNASLQNASSTAGYQSIIHPVSRDTIITEPV